MKVKVNFVDLAVKCGIAEMAEHNETDSDCPGDGWLSSWEKKCLDEWEKESVFEERLQVENEKTSQKIWQSFQNSATAVSRLFKGRMMQTISRMFVPIHCEVHRSRS